MYEKYPKISKDAPKKKRPAAARATAGLCRSGGCYQTIPGILARWGRLLRAFHHGERLEVVHVVHVTIRRLSHGFNGFVLKATL